MALETLGNNALLMYPLNKKRLNFGIIPKRGKSPHSQLLKAINLCKN